MEVNLDYLPKHLGSETAYIFRGILCRSVDIAVEKFKSDKLRFQRDKLEDTRGAGY